MSYHRSSGSASSQAANTPDLSPYSDNKENVPLHSQIFQRLQNSANAKSKPNLQKGGPPSPYNFFNQPKPTQSINIMKSLSPMKFSSFPLSKAFSRVDRPSPQLRSSHESGSRESESKGSQETDRGFGNTQREVRKEKDILIGEFRGIGEKLKQMKESDGRSIIGRFNSDRKEKTSLLEIYSKQRKPSDNGGDQFHKQISTQIEDLNERYRQLESKMANYQRAHVRDNKVNGIGNEESSPGSTNDDHMIMFQRLETGDREEVISELGHEIEQVKEQIRKNEEILKPKRELHIYTEDHNHDNVYKNLLAAREKGFARKSSLKSKDKENKKSSDPDKRRFGRSHTEKIEAFPIKRKEDEGKPKIKEDELEKRHKELLRFEEELIKREKIIREKEESFEANEKAFEELTQELEVQSEELTKQKVEYSQKVVLFNVSVQKFEKEKEEFVKSSGLKTEELKADQEKLQVIRKEIQIEQEMLEKKCKEILKGYDDYNVKKNMIERKEEEIMKKERVLQGDIENLAREKMEFLKDIELAEKNLREKETQLLEWERELDTRKNNYDDYDLKLLGMKLNEEVWQKKRDIEVVSLQEKIKMVKEKESELHKKEEKLNKMMEDVKKNKEDMMKSHFDSRETKSSERMTNHSDSLNEKMLDSFTSKVGNNQSSVGENGESRKENAV